MYRSITSILFAIFVCLTMSTTTLFAQTQAVGIVDNATAVLDEIMAVPVKRIPQEMLANAHGVAIFPNVVKAGFVAGARWGKGVVLVRDTQLGWTPPSFVTLTGGSLGWQAGVQSTDVILVFKTKKSVDGLLRGKFTIGVDAAAAAGPVGRQAAAATDGRLRAEIYSYSRSRGIFAGVSFDGSVIHVDQNANLSYYQGTGLSPAGTDFGGQAIAMPPSAVRLIQRLALYSGTTSAVEVPPLTSIPATPTPATNSTLQETSPDLKAQLAKASIDLQPLLDEKWKAYLALPGEVYAPSVAPNLDALKATLTRYDTVAREPRYQALTERPAYRQTLELLRKLVAQQSTDPTHVQLPPPPG